MARLSTWRYGFKSRWGDLTGFSGKTLFQSGLLLWSQHFNSLKILDSWPTGRGSRLKPGGGSFDSNTVHLRTWYMCMRMVQLRAQGLGPVWTATPYVDGSNPSVHFMSHSFNRRGQRTSNPPIRVRILYETSGYVAKRLCSGLLTRQTQVRVLSCPLLLINALVMQRQHTGLPNLVCGFDSRSGLSLGRIAEFVWFLHSR